LFAHEEVLYFERSSGLDRTLVANYVGGAGVVLNARV